jgi:hypothetical protein
VKNVYACVCCIRSGKSHAFHELWISGVESWPKVCFIKKSGPKVW